MKMLRMYSDLGLISTIYSHTEPLFRELSILKVEHIFQMQCLKLYYNVINEGTPDFFRICLN